MLLGLSFVFAKGKFRVKHAEFEFSGVWDGKSIFSIIGFTLEAKNTFIKLKKTKRAREICARDYTQAYKRWNPESGYASP